MGQVSSQIYDRESKRIRRLGSKRGYKQLKNNGVIKAHGSCDGSCIGNPGPAGFGCVLHVEGQEPGEWYGSLDGYHTNNVAEYTGLISLLKEAIGLGAEDLFVRMDSLLVVRQVTGRWRVNKPHLIPLRDEAVKLSQMFKKFRLNWVPRHQNTRADALAAIGSAQAGPAHHSEWVGKRGMEMNLEVSFRTCHVGSVGACLVFETAQGDVVKFLHSWEECEVLSRGLDYGTKLVIRGAVSRHVVRRGQRQTIISTCQLVELPKPASTWADEEDQDWS